MALVILHALFGEEDAGDGARVHPLTDFQAAAADRLRRIIDRRGGAILADAVGLGKTYVALALIEERLRSGGDVVVAIPAALRGLWRPLLRRVVRASGPGAARSSGRETSRGSGRETSRGSGRSGRYRLVSHAQLSRGVSVRAAAGPRLVVVDEAHRFRNPTTRRYAALARLVEPRAECLFLTATPINNTVDDLYHLVRLFLPDDGLRDAGVPSLRGLFDHSDAAGIRAVVRELVVRRSRRMVETRFGYAASRPDGRADRPGRDHGIVTFPERVPPRVHRYPSPGLAARLECIEALELSAYGPGAAPLLRLGLLKRLDSGAAALQASVGRLREFLAAFREAATAGRLLRPADRRIGGDHDPFQLLLLGVVAEPAPPELDLPALAAAADRDIRRLDRLLGDESTQSAGGAPSTPDPDPKARALVGLLRSLEGEKVLVFTEYRDTAEAVWRTLLPRFRVARIDGGGAWLGASLAGRGRVVDRFAPGANGRPEPPGRERVDVLVATDVLAEGLNLQDARHVVSYDLPWNPVRLLQRIGRVDRLGSPHQEVVPHLFVPANGLDAVLGLTRRLRRKLHGIVTALGEEAADALLEGLAAGRPDRVDTALRATAEDPVPMEGLRTLWVRATAPGDPTPTTPAWPVIPAVPASGRQVTEVGLTEAASHLQAVALLGGTPDSRSRVLEVLRDGTVRDPTLAAVRAIEAALADPRAQDAAPEVGHRRLDRVVRQVEAHLQARHITDRAPAPLDRNAARLARRIRNALADAGSGLDPAAVRRAETLLGGLAVPASPARAPAVAALLEAPPRHDSPSVADFLARVESALGTSTGQRPVAEGPAARTRPRPSVRAVILVRREP
ncbi:MAG: DEAD/DEAH box helicase [Longimicrobiales bacterium]